MPVKYLKWYSRELLQAEPEARFAFGDNCSRVGRGGQAAACRDEPNAIGVATLYAPGLFYDPADPVALAHVSNDLAKVARELAAGITVYAPIDGLGTGLARLPEHAPNLHRLIVAFFRAAPGETCPWKD
ncbi:DUF7831 domain-containing protein [Pelagibacterium lentulum]|uniref:DUF7831 domain-containing protein n=1 Tax=Pelagibacterium lentulum TaxID=2029865 RepID=A0A916W3T9_9HYPH|nr:hypothetical protein [Pelagibacterium lentulum]GGA63692.1 hypothetical protein GCM10011499_37560 [Pelagibacterium lentulum]